MRANELKKLLGLTAILAAMAVGCGDDSKPDKGDVVGDGDNGDGDNGDGDNGDGDNGDGDNGDGDNGGPKFAQLPNVLSITGCESVGLGPLCSVKQSDDQLTANCNGTILTGSIGEDRALTLAAADSTNEAGATVSLSCAGRFQPSGVATADCKQNVSAVGDVPAAENTCKLQSDRTVLPGVACLELPSKFSNLVVSGGEAPITLGTCSVIQDGCNFQAECADNVVITGTATAGGVSFSQSLVALADASNTPPTFLKGATVNHSCTGAIDGTSLTGQCTAGASGRGASAKPATSIYQLEAGVEAVPTCDLVLPADEHLLVLDSCDELKEGEGSVPGIGTPICAVRQNNCVWEVNCGSPITQFSGRLAPGAKKIDFRLLTGTPCELQFDAEGDMTGFCQVPGQQACQLRSIPAVPGGENCPVLPPHDTVQSHGCSGGSVDCRVTMQHGCDFVGLCSYTNRFADYLLLGKTSYVNERETFAFNGLAGYSCEIQQSTADEIENDYRRPNEWYGQCTNAEGGQCRDNWVAPTDSTPESGFRGLRVYFDLPK